MCVCAKVVLQPVTPEKKHSHLHTCYTTLEIFWFLVFFLFFLTLLLHTVVSKWGLSLQGRCWSVLTVWYRADQPRSALLLNTVSRTRFLRIPADIIWSSHLSLTTVPPAVFTSHHTLSWDRPLVTRLSLPQCTHTHTECICKSICLLDLFDLKILLLQTVVD